MMALPPYIPISRLPRMVSGLVLGGTLAFTVVAYGAAGEPVQRSIAVDGRAGVIGASSGGATTRDAANRMSFSLPAANMPSDRVRDFFFGNRLFNTKWIVAPASVTSFDGLGPVFNRASCSGCHVRDGRGQPPSDADAPMMSMLIRLSVPDPKDPSVHLPHPAYGGQLNDRAIPGVPAEGRTTIRYEEIEGRYADGERYSLRKPVYSFRDLAFGPMGKEIAISPRVAPKMIGLGLLEAIPERAILGRVDPHDVDGDGISGRPNWILDAETGRHRIGRFGWKANQPSLRQQNAGAFLGDIGITTPVFPAENCASGQTACGAAITGGTPEVSEEFLQKLTFYTQSLAVPARRNVDDPTVRRGEVLFSAAGCNACHVPSQRTGPHPNALVAHQPIQPFTDLLLHDMGAALADNRPDSAATGQEWRTPPLWGLGLIQAVNRHEFLLHDGRARSFAEAILWHGGEAETAKEAFRKMPKADRAAMLAFLKSL